jgi:hypothetical protein
MRARHTIDTDRQMTDAGLSVTDVFAREMP